MNFFNYTIKCIIRNIVRICFKPRNLAIIIVSLIIIFILSSKGVFAATEDNPWGSANLYDIYDWSNKAVEYDSSQDNYKVISYNGLHGKAIFVKPNVTFDVRFENPVTELHECVATADGSIPIVGSYCAESATYGSMPITAFYDFSTAKDSTILGYDVSGGCWLIYYSIDSDVDSVYLDNVVDVSDTGQIKSSIQDATAEIISSQAATTQAIEEQTDAINLQTSVIEDQTRYIMDNTINDSDMNIDTDDFVVDDEQGVEEFFTSFLNSIKTTYYNINSSVETIEIPLPYTTQKLVLTSDLLSKHIENTSIYNIIQVFWWFVIGSYLILYSKRIIDWLSTGEIAEKGPSAFIRYLDKNNELIKTYMM